MITVHTEYKSKVLKYRAFEYLRDEEIQRVHVLKCRVTVLKYLSREYQAQLQVQSTKYNH